MLSVKTCLHWFVRIAWLVGCSLGLFGYLCSTEPGFTCANSVSEPSYQETKNGYVSWWPSSHEIRWCTWELKRMAQKVLQHTCQRKARATSFSCHHFTLYLHCHHLLSHSLSSSQFLAHPELAPSGPSASRWRTLLIPTTSSSCRRLWCGINHWPNLVSLFMLILCRFGLSFLLDLGTQNR
jgi:hypothetical protein